MKKSNSLNLLIATINSDQSVYIDYIYFIGE